jgi:hypothetical protein
VRGGAEHGQRRAAVSGRQRAALRAALLATLRPLGSLAGEAMQLRALCSGLSLAAFALSSTSCGASAVEAAWWRGGAVALGAVQDALRGWTGVVSAAAEPEAEDDGGLGAIAGMLQRKGGYVDPRLRVGMTSYGVRGLFATEDIPAGTVLVYAPERAMLAAPPASGDSDTCELIKVILTELRKGNASEWWPYLRFDGSLGANLPATWTDEELSELQNLPPYGPRLYLDWYETECRPGVKYAELDDVEKQALWMQITRGADVGLFPVYDLTNHNNGALNTECHYPAGSQDGLNMVAKVPIAAGHEVTNTYGHLETSEVSQMRSDGDRVGGKQRQVRACAAGWVGGQSGFLARLLRVSLTVVRC